MKMINQRFRGVICLGRAASIFFLLCALSAEAKLFVKLSEPKLTGSKAVVKLKSRMDLRNGWNLRGGSFFCWIQEAR